MADSQSADAGARHVESTEEFDQLLESGRVLVDFYADWCGPCKMVAPTVDELAAERAEPVLKVDIEAHQEIAARYDVSSIPTFIAFENGEPVDRLLGVQDRSTLAALLD